jgi:hypothetical protein
MNCQKFEDVVSELARSQMMDADLRTEALDHAAECRRCMLRLSDEETLSRGFEALRHDMASLEAPVTVESRLLSAFRAPEFAEPEVKRNGTARYWLTAVAALFLIVLGVVAMRARTGNNQLPSQQATTNQGTTHNTAAATDTKPEPTASNKVEPERRVLPKRKLVHYVAKARKNASTRDQNVVANHAVNEVATEFMPLGYLTAANFQEGGQIVRVELPRAALANFGFPVNMDRYKERVKADVLLGADGLAHAIRFVQ